MSLTSWFLSADERGNPATELDRRHGGAAWTEGNAVEVLIDGDEYFVALHRELEDTGPGDQILFTGLEGNADERLLATEASAVGTVLSDAAARGVDVRGLVWRSHAILYNQAENLLFSRAVNDAGGQVLLDHRIRRWGSHHQKMVVILRGEGDGTRDVAFVGGMDLAHGRRDDPKHYGDPQRADLSEDNYGTTPPWHDIQLCVRGPAVADLAYTFRERWEDPNPLDTRNPWRALLHRLAKRPAQPRPLPPEPGELRAEVDGDCGVQVLRTYPARRRAYPFAPEGERSIARAYVKAFGRARRLVYLEDQYLWSFAAADSLCAALRREPELLVVAVIPRYPDPDGRLAGGASAVGRRHVADALVEAGGDRVAVYDLENPSGVPVYVHSKVCVVDDIWMAAGSDNLNRRSWTHDSEISCALLDRRRDPREPVDPSDAGDGARVLPRDTRLRLACEHAGLLPAEADAMVDPKAWFDCLRLAADALDNWYERGARGPRPPSHLRVHQRERVPGRGRMLMRWMHARVLDPDGRPEALRERDEF
jgi:phosphatidylserine/phosphatidylglycerophosphate/cardiolipin synthase-like enzyme